MTRLRLDAAVYVFEDPRTHRVYHAYGAVVAMWCETHQGTLFRADRADVRLAHGPVTCLDCVVGKRLT